MLFVRNFGLRQVEAYTDTRRFAVVRSLDKKWAQRLVVHGWRAARGGALGVQTMPHTPRILLTDQRSTSGAAPTLDEEFVLVCPGDTASWH
jgi:hypothetical protein